MFSRSHFGMNSALDRAARSVVVESLENRRLLSYTLLDTVKSPAPQQEGFFGQSMASDGSQVIVGAPGADSGAGQAHLLDADGDITQTFVNPDPQPLDNFGASVAFVGSDVLIGAPGDNLGIGIAYLFDSSGTLLQTFNNPAGNSGASFGANVAAYNGDVLIQTVAPLSGGGMVTQFTTGGSFVQNFVSPASIGGDSFGSAIAVNGNDLLIGAPNADAAFLFDDTSNIALESYAGSGGSGFGTAVAFDGGDVIVGSPFGGIDNTGVVERIDASDGSILQTYDNPTPDNTYFGELFGSSIAIDGDNLIVGSPADVAEVTYISAGEPVTVPVPVGGVYAIDLASELLEQRIVNPTPDYNDESLTLDTFGHAVAIAGGNLFASDPMDNTIQASSGSVYVFEQAVANQPPTADAGTYADLNENATILLDGSASSDPDGAEDILEYAWDLDNNGSYETIGQSVNFSQDLPGAYTVGLRVTDSQNQTSTDTAIVTFLDVAPTANAGADQNVQANDTVNLSGAGDNAAGDAIVSYEWDLDNNGSFETSGQNVSTNFAAAGTYTVNLRVTDDDGQTATDSVTITVTDPPPPSPVVLSGGVLTISGAAGGDDVDVTAAAGGNVSVSINGVSYGTFAPSVKIVIVGGGGNDDLQVAENVTLPAEIYGDAGNDLIRGGGGGDALFGGDGIDIILGRAGNDIVLGDDGADLIGGGAGRDLLIGGTGTDGISGDTADDILVAGSTAHDGNLNALSDIRAEWSSANSFNTRINNIRNGGGLNGSTRLAADLTVFDDAAFDLLYGGVGSDWLLGNTDSGVRDLILPSSGDALTDLDLVVT